MAKWTFTTNRRKTTVQERLARIKQKILENALREARRGNKIRGDKRPSETNDASVEFSNFREKKEELIGSER